MVEIDGRVGWYAGATVGRAGLFELRGLRYDNRGDQTVFDGHQYAWLTRFGAFGLRLQLPGDVELIGQQLRGDTHMGRTPTGEEAVLVPFQTTFGLVSVPIRRHRPGELARRLLSSVRRLERANGWPPASAIRRCPGVVTPGPPRARGEDYSVPRSQT